MVYEGAECVVPNQPPPTVRPELLPVPPLPRRAHRTLQLRGLRCLQWQLRLHQGPGEPGS